MWEVEDAIDTFNLVTSESSLGLLDDLLDDAIDTSYGRDDPNLVTNADLSVWTYIALEGKLLARWLVFLETLDMDVAIVEGASKVGLDILMVKVAALLDSMTSMADRETVLDDILAFSEVLQCALVASRNVGNEGDFVAINVNDSAFGQRLESNDYVVSRIDFQKLFHNNLGFRIYNR
jgi:hypothetical protein